MVHVRFFSLFVLWFNAPIIPIGQTAYQLLASSKNTT